MWASQRKRWNIDRNRSTCNIVKMRPTSWEVWVCYEMTLRNFLQQNKPDANFQRSCSEWDAKFVVYRWLRICIPWRFDIWASLNQNELIFVDRLAIFYLCLSILTFSLQNEDQLMHMLLVSLMFLFIIIKCTCYSYVAVINCHIFCIWCMEFCNCFLAEPSV